jgi:hypothetical protein
MIDTDTTRCLPVTMTAEECATKALQLATLCGEIAAAEVKAKELAAQARAGRCGACAKYWRVKGEERPRKGPLVVDESGADA